MHGHKVDRLRRRLFRRHHQIAFVFAISVVGHDHDFACRDISNNIVDRVEFQKLCRFN